MVSLVCVAHSDDEVIGMGGTIAKLAQKEDVYVVVFSNGDKWPFWKNTEEVIETRKKEVEKAGKILGVKKTYFFGLRDTQIKKEWDEKRAEKLHKIFIKHKPQKVFTHTSRDKHVDHHAVSVFVNEELKKHKNIEKFYFEVNFWSAFSLGEPKTIFDISDTFELKMKALDVFESQMLFIKMLKPLSVLKSYYYGRQNEYKYAEYFFSE